MMNVFSENEKKNNHMEKVPDTGIGVLDNTRPCLYSNIVN